VDTYGYSGNQDYYVEPFSVISLCGCLYVKQYFCALCEIYFLHQRKINMY